MDGRMQPIAHFSHAVSVVEVHGELAHEAGLVQIELFAITPASRPRSRGQDRSSREALPTDPKHGAARIPRHARERNSYPFSTDHHLGNRPPEVLDVRVTLHAGDGRDFYLLIPIVPPKE